MAALVAGVQYGLSSHSNFHENKSLIFVKLTDSAQRAIEDFLKNRSKTNQNPTIQFLGNEGQLSFPSSQSSHGSAGFTFSLSGNHDIEGPQGAFECIQQTGPKSLESLGTLPCKMRIQANDDVYETTRHRMAVAEENNKNKCTRVIKPNGPDIGRKVKVKATGRTIPPPSNVRHRESSNSNNNHHNNNNNHSSNNSSSNNSNNSSSSIPGSTNQSSRVNSYSSSTSSSGLMSSSLSYKHGGSSSHPPARSQPEKKLSDLARRPLKERLIHVLALRPFKKPELYERITREGIKERDRSTIITILKQVAYMRDNTYHLRVHVWNDVQEDWPFYSEQEKAMLKRRKPQNLTPPGQSSDGGSSGSGQSPNSTHPGSPPTIIAGSSVMASKRPGYYQGNDGIQTKKPRISHYKKPEVVAKTTTTTTTSSASSLMTTSGSGNGNINSNINNNGSNGNSVNSNGGGGGNNDIINNWNNDNGRQHRTDYQMERITNNSDVLRGSYSSNKTCTTPNSDCEDNVNINRYNNNNNTNNSGSLLSSSSHHSHANNIVNHNAYNSSCRHHGNVSGNDSKMIIQSVSGVGGGTSESNSNNINNNNNNNSSSAVDYLRSGGINISASSSSNNSSSGGNNNSYSINPSNGVQLSVDSGRRDGRKDRNDRNREREREREREKERERDKDNKNKNNDLRDNNNSAANPYNDFSNLGASNYPNTTSSSSSSSSSTTALSLSNPVTNSSNLTSISPSISSDSKEYPDYLTQYTAISSTEQRKRYKAEFTADYEEYRRLHAQVAQVSRRFNQLEERRQREIELENYDKSEKLRQQIINEYIATKSDPAHIETKKRFHYLHEKLSHIKRLVLEYDTQSNNEGSILKGGGLRY